MVKTTREGNKRAAIELLKRGLATQSEVAHLAGRDRQIVRHWAQEWPDAREQYLAKLWDRALRRARSE